MCNVASYGYNSLFKMFYHPRLWHEIVSVAFVCVSVCCVCEPLTFEGLGSETSFLIGRHLRNVEVKVEYLGYGGHAM